MFPSVLFVRLLISYSDSLRSDLMQKDGEIRLLQSRNREMKSRHGQELEELSSR